MCSAGWFGVWEYDGVSPHPCGHLFGGQSNVCPEDVAERCSDFAIEEYDPVELSTSDFEFVFGGSSKIVARVGEDFLFDGGGMHEV